MDPVENNNRLRWKCRRGMLELDLLLQGFLQHGYHTLPSDERSAFERLLEMHDEVLQGWLLGDVIPTEGVVANVVTKIRTTAAH